MTTQYLVGPTRTYTTIQAAVAALPGTLTGTGIHEIVVDSGAYSLTATLNLGSVGNASDYVHLKAATGSEWAGTYGTGVRLTFSSTAFSLSVFEFGRVSNIIVITGGCLSRNGCILENVMTYSATGGFVTNSAGGSTFYKCLAVNNGGGSFPVGFNVSQGTNWLYNCGSYGWNKSYSGNSNTVAINCWGVKASGGSDFSSFNASICSNNASTDATAPGANSLLSKTLGQMAFNDVSSNDFHILATSVLKNAGVDSSSIFTTDFDNRTILSWAIGPDSLTVATSGNWNVGPGETFLNWYEATQSISSQTLTGNITFTQTGNVTQSTSAALNPCNYAGFTIRYTSSRIHNGDSNQAWSTTFSGTGAISFGQNISQQTGGKHLIDNLYLIASGSVSSLIGFGNNGGSWYMSDLLFSQTNGIGGGDAMLVGNGSNLYIYNCKTWAPSSTFAGLALIGVTTGGVGELQIENCTAYLKFGPCYDISNASLGGHNSFIRNCIGIATTQNSSMFSVGSIPSSNNASSDSSASGSGSITGVTGSVFKSLTQSNTDFLNLAVSSILNDAGRSTTITGNNHGCRNNVRPHRSLYSIGADESTVEPYIPTASSPWQNKNPQHQKAESAKAPKLSTSRPEISPSFNSNTKQKEASSVSQDYSAKGIKEAGPTRFKTGGRESFQGDIFKFPKGAKQGFISVIPEANGYLGGGLGTGQKLQITSDSLQIDHQVIEVPFIGNSRVAKTRINAYNKSSGGFSYALRSNDSIPVFMSHFQNRIGSNLSGGTTYYEFSPTKNPPLLDGSLFGAGGYAQGSSNAFTVSVYKAIGGTGYHFKSGVSEYLSLTVDAGAEAVLTSNFKFGACTLLGTSGMTNEGTYSTMPSFPSQSCTINFNGLPVKGFSVVSRNRLIENYNVGTTDCRYKFGRFDVVGRVSVDVPKSAMAYIGSMLSGGTFNVYGTLLNSERDKLVFQMPNCRLDDFTFDLDSSLMEIPFKAYESDDGNTPPLKIMLWTQNYSGTSFQPN